MDQLYKKEGGDAAEDYVAGGDRGGISNGPNPQKPGQLSKKEDLRILLPKEKQEEKNNFPLAPSMGEGQGVKVNARMDREKKQT